MNPKDTSRIEVFLDDQKEPIASYSPPAKFDLDTSLLEDGKHKLKIIATDSSGRKGVRNIPFEVRNGPGIAVQGLNANEIVEGNVSLIINAYGGSNEDVWYPHRAETPAPIPTWAWIIFILVVAWGLFYATNQWKPGPEYADSPTYAPIEGPTNNAALSSEGTSNLGANLYRTSCASCHQANGQGIPEAFPPLAGDPVVIAADPTEHIQTVLFGTEGRTIKGKKYLGQMPAWESQLSDEETAAIINHERTSWGNSAPIVTPQQVSDIRKSKTASR